MFLILGTGDCKYCLESKKLLENNNLNYLYYDLFLRYNTEWRVIFKVLKSHLKSQKTIPIIFHSKNELPVDLESIDPENLLEDWDLVGNYFDLVDIVDDLDLSIDDNY